MPDALPAERVVTFSEAVRETLTEAGRRDPSILFFAEGIDDPSGMFGTTKGLREALGANRVVEMPIAENALTGVAVGAAMVGRRPVISLQRVEFALLALDQILNNAAKAHYISAGAHKIPLVLRMVVGRGWGQGPEHSQSLEALFAMIPGLKVVMPCYPADAKGLLAASIQDDNPVVFIEHRWIHYASGHVPPEWYALPLDGPLVVRRGSDITLVATSYMTLEAQRAAEILAGIGISAEVIDLRVLRPLNVEPILASVRKTGRLITVDTGWRSYGVGAEIVSRVAEQALDHLRVPPKRLGMPDHPTPSSRGMVPGLYPDAASIAAMAADSIQVPPERIEPAIAAYTASRAKLPIDVPDPYFRGPF